MSGKRYQFVKSASAFLFKKVFGSSKVPPQSKVRLVSDIYRDFKKLKKGHPLNKAEVLKYKLRKRRQLKAPMDSKPITSSRRQRLLGLAKATRDTYIPRITGSVSLIASGVSQRAWGDPLYDEFGNLRYPKDTSITLFPAYTRCEQPSNEYHIDVKGWLSCPGLMTRKNRLILSLARQITKYNSNAAAVQAIDQLESEKLKQDTLQDQESDLSDSSSSIDDYVPPLNSPNSSTSLSQDDLIKERLANFIARSIPNAELSVIIGSHDRNDVPISKNVITDANGHFEACVKVPYKPSVVQVKAATDETIFTFQDIMLVSNDGIGLISDIDDTVKMTGVIGDKRELLSTLLLKDVSLWKIPSVISWYDNLSKEQGISFHYVSNSPWQLFSTINQYFKESDLPVGSVHLKQYTGNIISALMEPSTSRKKIALARIIDDFSQKKFICVGDSGEWDLEAYVDLAKTYPNRVAAIYIRYVEHSLSDIDDVKIYWELEKILHNYESKINQAPIDKVSETIEPSEIEDLIDLTDAPVVSPVSADIASKLPPMVPKKPQSLKGNQLLRKPRPDELLVKRAHTDTDLSRKSSTSSEEDCQTPPPLPKRSTTIADAAVDGFDTLSRLNKIPGFNLTEDQLLELEDTDPKGAAWIRRILESTHSLQGTNTKLKLFKDDEAEFFKTSIKLLNDHYEKTSK